MICQNDRDKPYRYIKKALVELSMMCANPTIVEIGSMRDRYDHDLDNVMCSKCNDGHSTAMWARTGYKVITVDINAHTYTMCKEVFADNKNVTVLCMDGIRYLEQHEGNIDLLFLDGWDLDLPNHAEKHLEAYRMASKKLSKRSIVLVDDTDLTVVNGEYFMVNSDFMFNSGAIGGKAKLLPEELEKDGFELVFTGRQTMWRRT